MTRRSSKFLELAVVVGTLAFIAVLGPRAISTAPETSSSRQHLYMAYNLFQYGVLSASSEDRPDPQPGYRREPLVPTVVAGLLALLADPDETTLECLATAAPECQALLRSIKLFNVALFAALCLSTLWAGHVVTKSRGAACVGFLLVASAGPFWLGLDHLKTELPSALALVLGSTCLYCIVDRERSLGTVVGAGMSFGALILIKAVFFYIAPVLLIAAALIDRGKTARRALIPVLGVVLIAYGIAGVWVMRNFLLGAGIRISEDRSVLAIRAEYSTMSWPEYAASWFYDDWNEAVGSSVAERLFGPEANARLRRDNPDGYYRRAKNQTGVVARKTGVSEPSAAQMSSAASAVIRENWPMHLALTGPFAVRGSFVWRRYFDWRPPRIVLIPAMDCLIPALLIVSGITFRKREYAVLLFLLPSLYSFGLHTAATHNIARYSWPLIPTGAVALTLLVAMAWQGAALTLRRKKFLH